MWTLPLLGVSLGLLFCGGSSARSAGQHFATAFMQNYIAYYGSPVLQLQITSVQSNCCVSVSVPSLNFLQKATLAAGQALTVTLPVGVEVYGSQRSSNTVLVQASKEVCVTSLNAKFYTADTTVVYPRSEWGVEYFIFTPSVSPPSTQKQLMFINGPQRNVVEVYLRGNVVFQGTLYQAGSKLVVWVEPYESVQLQSEQDLTGTRILSQLPVGVYTGHTCTWFFSKCNHVFEQLLPVPSWGTRFLVPAVSVQSQYDSIYVQASQATQVIVRSSSTTQTANLTSGQAVEFRIRHPDALSITSDKGIQVLYLFNGVQISWSRMYDSFMLSLMPNDSFCYSFALNGQDGFDNRALLVVPSKDVTGILFNGSPLSSSLQWRRVETSEYSWAELVFQAGAGKHNVTHPSSAFGLYGVGLALMNGYGAAALCTVPTTCSSITCNSTEQCQMLDFRPTCVKLPPEERPGVCWAMGDPHYRTFDGRYFDFMGTCTYVLTKNCGNNSLPAFEVQTQNENRGNAQVSFVGLVNVNVGGFSITIDRLQKGRVRINHTLWTLPVLIDQAGINVTQSGLFVTIQTSFGLTVQYDWDIYVRVTLPAVFKSKVCGLCGNYNGNPDDDLTTSSSVLTPSVAEFGCSWTTSNQSECLDCAFLRDFLPSCDEEVVKEWEGEQDCGILNTTTPGPFSRCNAVVDPFVYIQNCLFDTCMAGGLRLYLCKALEVYADACLRAGVQMSDWRGPAKCSYSCPENSHYELCGSACPATCMDPRPAGNCSLPCVETCSCNAGYVLSGAVCVPSTSCGCSQNGRYVPAGESFWADDHCSSKCECPAGGGQLLCQNMGCKSGQQCQVMNGILDCYPVSHKTCLAFGDPHYHTFDGRRFDFQGTSMYQLVGVCSSDPGLVQFKVLVQNDVRGSRSVSFTKLLQVKISNITINISTEYKGSVMVNGVLVNLPQNLAKGLVFVFKSGFSAVVQTSFGLTVTFDWTSIASVTIPSTYMGSVCGLCGNYNGNPGDDLNLRGTNSSSSSVDEFGMSWSVLDVPGSVNQSVDNNTACDVTQRERYESADYCGLIQDPNGPFMECQALLNPAGFFQACVSDVCAFAGRRDVLCQAITAYMSACQDLGARVYPWRSVQFCGVQCPLHSHYEVCGPGCPATCYSLGNPLSCQRACREGCLCDQGFILSGDTCVPFIQCGCQYSEQYYPQGQLFYPDTLCHTQCRCMENGQVSCRNVSCGLYETCVLVDGIRQCQPVGKAVCDASGDPHYVTFDGLRFDFQGSCGYVLSQACGLQGTSLEDFSVEVQNQKWPNSVLQVSVTKQVSLAVYGYTFVLRQNMAQILVNGLLTDLPWSLNDTKVQIYKLGLNYVIMTDFGLRVTYDLSYHVTVTVPSTYHNRTCGLCGNYDGNLSNDLLLPGGNITTDVGLFGKAWKVQSPGLNCEDEDKEDCHGSQCPVCDLSLRLVFETPAYCGLISESSGPFSACHAVVDPAGFLENCVFDVCVSGGSTTVACQSLAAYAFKCNTAGVTVKRWRTESFCPLSCPVNSHYELCADVCSAACPALTDVIRCSSVCTEGCSCDLGFMFNGHQCVQYDQCGCYQDGRVYKTGEVVYQAQCQQRCVCDAVMGLMCEQYSCPNGTHCGVRGALMSCLHTDPCQDVHCREKERCSVFGGRAVCVPLYSATCWAWGDLHYLTFDGFNYDLQGSCWYILSESCGALQGLEPFTVTERNHHRASDDVSVVREVEVNLYNITITIQKYKWGQIMVDGEMFYLPLDLLDGQIKVRQVGQAAVIETDFGFRLSYDWSSELHLQLPSSYHNRVCGLCGNFNGSADDELVSPAGDRRASVVQWARSWRTDVSDLNCTDGCERDCPVCSLDQQRLYNTELYCGALTFSDLFKACRAKVDPVAFQRGCVYDLCVNNGDRRLLCDALETYSTICRQEGFIITDWRKILNCPMRCQPNSHYEACASPCNSTCSSLYHQPTCTGVCVEECVCDQGFLLSAGSCVPADQCGCYYEGRYYLQGQSFWMDEKCVRRCVCDATLGVVVCAEDSCSTEERCEVVDGIRTCVAAGEATCEVYGDPHYRTFDGRAYDFQGSCRYQLVALCSNTSALIPFNVTVQNEQRASSAVSFTRTVMVSVFSVSISISRDHLYKILFDGVLLDLPLEIQNKLLVYLSSDTVVLKTSFGLKVTFDRTGRLTVTLPSTYTGAVCGLAGNYNGNIGDDFAASDGTHPADVVMLGQSWQVGSETECSSSLFNNTQNLNCTGAQREEARLSCSIISDRAGPFKHCHPVVNPGPYTLNCEFDTCQYQGLQAVLCDAIAAYVSACQATGVTIQPWRNNTFCSPQCPANSQYNVCIPGCPESCASLWFSCSERCSEGCQCEPGFVLSGQTCVSRNECGCFYGGRYYRKHQVFYADSQCQKKCECVENGAVSCQASSCGPGEVCGVMEGVLGCHWSGYSHCVASGDPHYMSFDGRMFDFQGVCVYTLARVCINAENKLIYFSVETENESIGRASIVKIVTVSVYNFTINIRQTGDWIITVNSEAVNLPVYLNNGKISLTHVGFGIKLLTDFGLQVFYIGGHVDVQVPSIYNNSMCGLCGNYNGNPADDFLLPNGNQSSSVVVFGQAWALAPPGVPCGGCGDFCPKFEASTAAVYQGNNWCGLLSSPAGPFSSCHKKVDPQVFVNNCVFDMCVTAGNMTTLCQSFEVYTSICQQAGVNIQAWRNSSFCSPRCPVNSHYSLCSDTCANTCASLALPVSGCVSVCVEGCRCDQGFVWSGGECVPLKACGCIHDGKYLKVGESLVSRSCDVKCRCVSGGVVQCVQQVCSSVEVCDVRDGYRGCYPELGRCVVEPDAQLRSFDGALGKLEQPGAFQMVLLCDDQSADWFRLVANVRLSSPVSPVSVMNIYIFFQNIFITVNNHKHSWVNGKLVSYPNSPAQDVVIRYTGDRVVIERVSSIRVEYTHTQQLTLTISHQLAGRVCGVCGNFNRNLTDELRNSSSLSHWQAEDFSTCGL